jgi:hypothetical protein
VKLDWKKMTHILLVNMPVFFSFSQYNINVLYTDMFEDHKPSIEEEKAETSNDLHKKSL